MTKLGNATELVLTREAIRPYDDAYNYHNSSVLEGS